MAARVVELLEMIKVEEHERHLLLRSHRAADRLLNLKLEMAMAEQPRQRVGDCGLIKNRMFERHRRLQPEYINEFLIALRKRHLHIARVQVQRAENSTRRRQWDATDV